MVTHRTRSRPHVRKKYLVDTRYNPYPGLPSSFPSYTEYFTDSVPGSCACSHFKYKTFDCSIDGKPPHAHMKGKYENWLVPFAPNFDDTYFPLDWDKLPTSSGFGVLEFLAEIDDTIAMFTKRFWKQLSYGSLNWGVLPFISDVKALLKTISNLSDSVSSIPYEDAFDVELIARAPVTGVNSNWWYPAQKAKGRIKGHADISMHLGAQRHLDRLGFHPDLATAWNLVPLSFLVDYLIPVGDFLESFRHGGWVKTAYFTGWSSIKGTCKYTFGFYNSTNFTGTTESSVDFYMRRPWSGVLIAPSPRIPDLDLPTPRQLFNMLYVYKQRR